MQRAFVLVLCVLLAGCAAALPRPEAGADLYYFHEGDRWGFKDQTGAVIVPAMYDDVRRFAYGRAPVNRGAVRDLPGLKDGGEWGYIDTRGEVIVPLTLRDAREFSEGLALVWDRSGARYIDTEGRTVILAESDTAGDFSEGLAPVYMDRSREGKDWQTRFIDARGKTVLVVEGYAHEFHEGLSVLTVSPPGSDGPPMHGFINMRGDLVIRARFAQASAFSEGLAAVRAAGAGARGQDGLCGYIDPNGRYAIEPRFNEAHQFRFGMAIVHVGGTLRVTEESPSFWEGGEWWLIDRRGEALTRGATYLECQRFAANLRQPGR